MSTKLPIILLWLGIAGVAQLRAQYTSDIDAYEFADTEKEGLEALSEDALITYLVIRKNVLARQLVPVKGSGETVDSLRRKAVEKDLKKIRGDLGDPPYVADALEDYLFSREGLEKPAFGTTIPVLTVPKQIGRKSEEGTASLGPLQIRKDPGEVWKERKDAAAAKVQYAENYLDSAREQKWTTEGALILPFYREVPNIPQGLFRSAEFYAGPAAYWNVVASSSASSDEVDELQFSVPFSAGLNRRNTLFASRWTLVGKPYYHTDFDFDGQTLGATLSFEPRTSSSDRGLRSLIQIGRYNALGDTSGKLSETLAYRIRMVPKLDYGNVTGGGDHTNRSDGDEWFRIGSLFEFSLRFFGKDSPLELTAGYEFLSDVSGDADFNDYFYAKGTRWLQGENIGLTLEYKNGDTPVTGKEIDLLSLGISVRF